MKHFVRYSTDSATTGISDHVSLTVAKHNYVRYAQLFILSYV